MRVEPERRTRIVALLTEKAAKIRTEIDALSQAKGVTVPLQIEVKQGELARVEASLKNYTGDLCD